MDEEKGIKEVEKWRELGEQSGLVQKEESYVNNANREEMIERNLKILRGLPQDRPEEETKTEIKIVKPKYTQEFKSFTEKGETEKLDSMLLGGKVDIIEKDRSGVTMPVGYQANEDLLDDSLDDLLSKPIGSILDKDKEDIKVVKYKSEDNTGYLDTSVRAIDTSE